jgi:hypothetical protein
MVTLAVPEADNSAWLVAVIVTLGEEGSAAGAVYNPVESMVPTAESPPPVPFTAQFTAVFVVPVTVAVNCCCSPRKTDAVAGATETVTEAGGGPFDDGEPPAVPHPAREMAKSAPSRDAAFLLHLPGPSEFLRMSAVPLLTQVRQGNAKEQGRYPYLTHLPGEFVIGEGSACG